MCCKPSTLRWRWNLLYNTRSLISPETRPTVSVSVECAVDKRTVYVWELSEKSAPTVRWICHEMSRDAYVGGNRSPRGVRLPTVDRSPSRAYPGGSPIGRKPLRQSRSGNNSPDHTYGSYHHSSSYYRDEDLGSPMLEERGRPMTVGPGHHHRSRSATRYLFNRMHRDYILIKNMSNW